MKKGAKITIGVVVGVLIVGGVLYAFKDKIFNKKGDGNGDNTKPKPKPKPKPSTTKKPTEEYVKPSPSNPKPKPTTSKPEDVRGFQQWAIDNYPLAARTTLGSFGADGAWGSRTAKAWEKWGNEYKKYLLDYKNDPLYFVARNTGGKVVGDSVSVMINGGLHKGTFYDSGRFVINKVGATGYTSKGYYYNGGKTIKVTAAAGDKNVGKTFNDSSPINNLEDAIK
jgi:hypothetical protein